jgi:hypothetical protein
VQVLDSTGTVILSGDGDCRGGAVNGSEHLRETAALAATADAPAGAAGVAAFNASTVGGTTTALLTIRVKGLAAGTYTIDSVSTSTSAVTALGTVTVESNGKGTVSFGSEDGTAFPDGFDPLDIATIEVADASGTILLSGDLSAATAGTTATFTGKVKTTAGSGATSSSGSAAIVSRTVGRSVSQAFALTAKGLPVSTTLTLKVNGVVSGQVKTSRSGTVSLAKLPSGATASKVTSVTLDTASGQRVLGAYF